MLICLVFSVPRCARYDVCWIRVPYDVSETLWIQQRRTEFLDSCVCSTMVHHIPRSDTFTSRKTGN